MELKEILLFFANEVHNIDSFKWYYSRHAQFHRLNLLKTPDEYGIIGR